MDQCEGYQKWGPIKDFLSILFCHFFYLLVCLFVVRLFVVCLFVS